MTQADVAILGGGIIGLATAWQLTRQRPHSRVVVVEKEASLATHQTGRNSGVIHSGIYYRPGSLRAENCREGKRALEEFCDQFGVAWERTGKVIVASSDRQLPALEQIFERGQKNGVTCRIVEADELAELEPHVQGIRAVHVPGAGIVDYPGMCIALAEQLRTHGVDIRLSTRVTGIHSTADSVEVQCGDTAIVAGQVVNCTGLFSDRVARMSGQRMKEKIIPFRGEYFTLTEEATHLCLIRDFRFSESTLRGWFTGALNAGRTPCWPWRAKDIRGLISIFATCQNR